MKVNCVNCGEPIAGSNLSVAKDLAVCERCGEVFPLSALVGHRTNDFDPTLALSGTSFEHLPDGFRITASTRSLVALFLVPFAIVWSGLSCGMLYGSQFMLGFNPLLSLIGLPFLAVSCLILGVAVMHVAGSVVITVDHDVGTIFTGIGPIGRTRSFSWSQVSDVDEVVLPGKGRRTELELVGQIRLRFGSLLNAERQHYVRRTLCHLLLAASRS